MIRLSFRALSVLAPCLVAVSCSKEPTRASTTSQVGDTIQVHNVSAAWPGTRKLIPIATIGTANATEDYQFRAISGFAVDARGRAYIAELEGPLRQYDSAGQFVATIARQGAGPGEVRYVKGLVFLANGGLVVRDQGNGRLNVYGPDLTPAAHWKLPSMSGYGAHTVRSDTLGAIFVALSPSHPASGAPEEWPRPVYAKLDSSGTVVDTIWAPPRYLDHCSTRSSSDFRSGWFEDARWTYLPKVTWSLTPAAELIIGCPATKGFDVLNADGTVTRVTFEWPQRRASQAEREAFKALVTLGRRNLDPDWSWTGPDLPPERPPYLRLIGADDGRVWVWRTPATHRVARDKPYPGLPDEYWEEEPGGTFDVFARAGEYLGEVEVPESVVYGGHPGTPDPVIRGDTVWFVTEDSLGAVGLTRFLLADPSIEP